MESTIDSTIMAMCSSQFSEHLREKTFLLLVEVAPLLFSQKVKFLLYVFVTTTFTCL